MKKLLLLLFVTALFQVNAQTVINQTINISANDAYEIKTYVLAKEMQEFAGGTNTSYSMSLGTVPQGETWYFAQSGWIADTGFRFYITSNHPESNEPFSTNYGSFPEGMWSEGTIISARYNSGNNSRLSYVIYKFFNSDITLASNFDNPVENSKILAFPNPTTNELALNSDKVYQIEVFDLTGNKVMELKGNTISVEHLSSATYIVNAIDLETKESLSYKVIKN
ncbi:T9SS type A sorting domain-containing protein [Flavobacteriaceae bacterium]|jgi:hypothetical protein|nr:T9SS type A sorting domain-containing protein [Flavobacteriaceae bacterium]